MSTGAAPDKRRTNETRSNGVSLSDWMRWNDIGTSVERLRPPLDLGESFASTDPERERESEVEC